MSEAAVRPIRGQRRTSRGSCWRGDTRKLPENLLGCSIQITTRKGDSWISTIVEVIERREDFVLVQDSGKG